MSLPDLNIIITEQARRRINEMTDRIRGARASYGAAAVEPMSTSFALSFGRLVGMGGTIGAEGSDSLLAVTGYGITVGMIWFPEDRRKTLLRGGTELLPDEYTDEKLVELFPIQAGEWSLHS